MLKKNIAILGIPQKFVKTISMYLADKIEMFYADVDELFAYEIKDLKSAETKSSKNYLRKAQSKQVKYVSSFENTIINISYSALISDDNYKFLQKNSLIVFINLSNEALKRAIKQEDITESKEIIEQKISSDKIKFYAQICNIKVNSNSIDKVKVAKEIINSITNYFD